MAFGWTAWRNRLVARPGFQAWAARSWLTRSAARRDGEALMDLVSGFVYSQILLALVELNILDKLKAGAQTAEAVADGTGVPVDRIEILLQGAAALGLTRRARRGRFALSRKGAAMLGVPGLMQMIRHHRVFYADMADPVALLKGESETELARFWPYVFGAGAAEDPDQAAAYSDLMAQTQALVAQEVLGAVKLDGVDHVLDVGGGTGAFLTAVGQRYKGPELTLFDLPAVAGAARVRLDDAGLGARAKIVAGSFRDDPLPEDADVISLVRVLYDHRDATVEALLQSVHGALRRGGRVIVAEPMSGGAHPTRWGDAYFAFYTLAMQTGRARSAARIMEMLGQAGFTEMRSHATRRPFITQVVTARKPV